MANAGRRCVLDDKKKSRILVLLMSGCSRVTAANSVGCHPKTIVNTAKRDQDFAKRLALAEDASELIHLDNINKAGKDTRYWRASAWMLERLHPERFGTSKPDAVTPAQVTSLIVQIAEIIVQEIPVAMYRKQILKRFDRLLAEACLFKDNPNSNPARGISFIELPPTVPEQTNHESN
jgi:hypothetical protein